MYIARCGKLRIINVFGAQCSANGSFAVTLPQQDVTSIGVYISAVLRSTVNSNYYTGYIGISRDSRSIMCRYYANGSQPVAGTYEVFTIMPYFANTSV